MCAINEAPDLTQALMYGFVYNPKTRQYTWPDLLETDGARDGDRWEPLGSAGIGVRLDVRPWLSITPEIAQQLDGVPTDTRNPDLETRFFISAVARF